MSGFTNLPNKVTVKIHCFTLMQFFFGYITGPIDFFGMLAATYVGHNSITISWPAAVGVDGYEVRNKVFFCHLL